MAGHGNSSAGDGITEDEGKNGFRSGTLIIGKGGRENQIEMEGEYFVSSLVWGKVKSHPWWPGQILEPSFASDKVMKYFKNDSYLVGYFGDQTFAWNDASNLKPFDIYFLEMEKQSRVEAFKMAVDSALDEVSRRVECGLICGCLPEAVLDMVKCQVFNNGDSCEGSLATSFVPAGLVDYLKSLAEEPKAAVNRLQFTTVRGQLLAFKRWKGCYELPAIEEFTGILENDVDQMVLHEDKKIDKVMQVLVGSNKCGALAENGKFFTKGKRKNQAAECQRKRKKKCVLELMPTSSSCFSNGKTPQDYPTVDEMLSKMVILAKTPMETCTLLESIAGFFFNFRNSICSENNSMLRKEELASNINKEDVYELVSADVFMLQGRKDSYWTDRMIQHNLEDEVLLKQATQTEPGNLIDEPKRIDVVNLKIDGMTQNNLEEQKVFEFETPFEPQGLDTNAMVTNTGTRVDENSDEYSPTLLILNFNKLESIPSIENLNKIFTHYGPLHELDTEILCKSKRAKMFFKRRSDADDAFSSAGKYRIFGPSLISYRLKYLPKTYKSSSASKAKRRRKNAITAIQRHVIVGCEH